MLIQVTHTGIKQVYSDQDTKAVNMIFDILCNRYLSICASRKVEVSQLRAFHILDTCKLAIQT
jgi:hypothetical protein